MYLTLDFYIEYKFFCKVETIIITIYVIIRLNKRERAKVFFKR